MKLTEVTCYLQDYLCRANWTVQTLRQSPELPCQSLHRVNLGNCHSALSSWSSCKAVLGFTCAYRHFCSVSWPSVTSQMLVDLEVSSVEVPGNLPQCFIIINTRKSFLTPTCESSLSQFTRVACPTCHWYIQQVIPFLFTVVFYLNNIRFSLLLG